MGIAVIYGSARRNGNSDQLAKRLTEGFDAVHLYLSDYTIEPIKDYRHSEKEPYPEDDYHSVIEQVLAQDTIVFATPIYWYGASGLTKTFIDRWSQSLREDREGFLAKLSGKSAWVIGIGDDEPHLKGIPLILQFQSIFEFTRTKFEGYILGKANRPGDILEDKVALATVEEIRNKWRGVSG
ncbi:NADPH-dependent FMN reductase [Paenibacillus curdlanolyticus YK9]|uniref:NADPH-dependent FMN reductase n=1 Tax=Paenibacillus curdlanolyticus YK9 TaxID=717606 RepID=E0IE69_9BACL|nr:flavodoxin family protein [Paenibacillus curdlanolyticus]EFM09423.1 NADPH-dependent FMN reductase [Paenibacillus curdlanolyticus YK9]